MRRITGTGRRARMTAAAATATVTAVTGVTGVVLASATAAQTGTMRAVATAVQAGWTPITTLTASGWEGVSAVISADGSGDFLTAWSGIRNGSPNCHEQTQIRIRFRTGKLGNVEQLTPCGQPDTFFPEVAQNANGYGVAAWITSSNSGIKARLISPTGKLGPLITVTPPGYQADLVNVAMSPTGQALVTWHEISSVLKSPNTILARFIGPNSVQGAIRYIYGATGQLPPVVFDKAGTATIGWSTDGDATMARRITATGTGSSVNIFGPKGGGAFGVPRLAEDSNGDTFFLATANVSVNGKVMQHVLLRKWSRSGALGPVITVASANSTLTATNVGDGPSLGVDGVGDAVVAWDSALSFSSAAVWGRRVTRAGKLGPSVRLGTGYLPKVGVAPGGAGLVTWQPVPFASPYPSKVFGRRASATAGTFGGQLQFTGDGGYAAIAVDPAGVFGVIWVKSSLGSFIQARFGR